jgi:hypothetical protein
MIFPFKTSIADIRHNHQYPIFYSLFPYDLWKCLSPWHIFAQAQDMETTEAPAEEEPPEVEEARCGEMDETWGYRDYEFEHRYTHNIEYNIYIIYNLLWYEIRIY